MWAILRLSIPCRQGLPCPVVGLVLGFVGHRLALREKVFGRAEAQESGGAFWMLLQELRQRQRGQTNRLWVIIAVRYPATELAPYDINMSRWRVANITSRI